MRRVLVLAVTAGFVLMCSSQSEAFLFGKKKQEPAAQTGVKPAAPAAQAAESAKAQAPKEEAPKAEPAKPKIDKAQKDAIEYKRKLLDKKRGELNNTEWQVELTPLSGKGNKEGETIVIKNNQVTLVGYGKRGFPTTNYTMTVQDDGSVVLETMQTSEKSGIAFLRAEMDAGLQGMRGVLSHRIDDATSHDYSLVSTSKKNLSAEPPQEK